MKSLPDELSPIGRKVAGVILACMEQGVLDVPVLPEIAQRVLTLINEPDSDATRLAKLIQSDQSLAANVMRIANSAAYTPNASMISLQQAIARLGMNMIGQIALSATLNARMFKAPVHETRIAEIWQLSLFSALWAKEISRMCRLNVETAFLCGLLSSIGRAVTLHMACDIAGKEGATLSATDTALLEEHFHVDLGVRVMEIWKLPAIVIEAIGYQDNYEHAPRMANLARITFGAVQFAIQSLAAEELDKETLSSLLVITELNLYPEDMAQLFSRREAVVGAMEAMSL